MKKKSGIFAWWNWSVTAIVIIAAALLYFALN